MYLLYRIKIKGFDKSVLLLPRAVLLETLVETFASLLHLTFTKIRPARTFGIFCTVLYFVKYVRCFLDSETYVIGYRNCRSAFQFYVYLQIYVF
jgi:hypothetical protein